MGRLVDGEWRTDVEQLESDDDGSFERAETSFRDAVEDAPGAEFPVAPGRYHLYVSYACPWAHRTLITRALLGLRDTISVDVVDPHRVDRGWEFAPEKPGCTADSVADADYLHEIYTRADPEYTGRVTVPVLYDRHGDTIVNNESEEIVKQLDTAFGAVRNGEALLYPEGRREEIDAIIDDIYPSINNGVYRAGFAESQAAYDEAVDELFDALEEYDELLADRRYLAGEVLTLADVCMFTTLYRFDEVYHTHFACNVAQITDFEQLWGYLRELYQLPGVAETCHMDHVKEHYYRSHDQLNPAGLVPTGPDPAFDAPHDRDELPGGLPEALLAAAGAATAGD